ncbi:LysR family transcriptional regulator [Bosea sp. 685]|uniref:LysR family transcriptional regulator n=1 Tax=Bosea sp. 685 TaxID=3080057 RepID=UPI002892D517|nr:LysR family transcriptional regulator [Bosea sp. 685]WNJ89250.1 LysR family transcriptional regulator [Bosea sp. 685]
MDIRWLQDFLTVAERGNFTRAAEERNASQAAFSRRIQALETWLGVTLIDRSVFPTRLTPEGERFRETAAETLHQLLDAKTGLSGQPTAKRDQVVIALPHALATGRLPGWWASWSQGRALSCKVAPGNVHDTVTALVSGAVDLLVCFHHAQQPIHLDAERYDRLVIGVEHLRPYVAAEHAERWPLPGKAQAPLPLLMYSAGAYLGRMVDLIIEAAPEPLAGHRLVESDMADVLRDMAVAGYGIAWLPECAAAAAGPKLVPAGGEAWAMPLSLVAYRDSSNRKPALHRLWAGLAGDHEERQSQAAAAGTKDA